MKRPTLLLVLAALFAALNPVRADFLVQPNDSIAICGDSITEQHLYSTFMEEYLLMCQPTAGQKIMQFGWSGEQAPSFLQRFKTDVLPFKPTVATTCYGMNDGHYGPINDDVANTYRKAQTGIVDLMKSSGVRVIVLGSPKCVDSYYYHRGNPEPTQGPEVYNKTLGSLAEIDKQIAQQEGVIYADVYDVMLATMQKAKAKLGANYIFAGPDGVHPLPNGHLVMAYVFLKALGCDGNIGTITVDSSLNQAQATPGHEIVSCQDGTVTVKSTRYPFCLTGDDNSADPNTTAAVTQFFPFNQDLNRFMLVVKSLNGSKAKVTWGGATKEYTAEQLASGVNLAADFHQNPFFAQFLQVQNAILAQATQETLLSKMFLHNEADWKTTFAPGIDSLWDQIVDAGMKQHDALFQKAAALVVPITHTIKIAPEP